MIYSRTRLRRTRLGNNKKYVLSEVRRIVIRITCVNYVLQSNTYMLVEYELNEYVLTESFIMD